MKAPPSTSSLLLLFLLFITLVLLSTTTTASPSSSNEKALMDDQNLDDWIDLSLDTNIVRNNNNHSNNHELWDQILSSIVLENKFLFGVSLSVIDYVALRRDARFIQYLNELAQWKMNSTSTLSRMAYQDEEEQEEQEEETKNEVNEKLALYLNAYNAWAMYIVAIQPCKFQLGRFCYPVKSIWDLGTSWKREIFDEKVAVVAGEKLSLNDIEEILRKLGFAQFHACIVCASVSCPNVRKGAYVASKVQEQMKESTIQFLANESKGMKLDQKNNQLHLSSIFDWNSGDFTNVTTGKHLIDFVIEHAPTESDRDYLLAHRSDFLSLPPASSNIAFLKYDWRLNKAESL